MAGAIRRGDRKITGIANAGAIARGDRYGRRRRRRATARITLITTGSTWIAGATTVGTSATAGRRARRVIGCTRFHASAIRASGARAVQRMARAAGIGERHATRRAIGEGSARIDRHLWRAVPGVMSAAVGSRHARIGGAGDFLRAARGIAGSRATRSDAGHEQYEQSRHDMKTLMHKQSPFRVKKPRRQPRSHRASECCVNETTGELRYALARFYRCVVAITADRSL